MTSTRGRLRAARFKLALAALLQKAAAGRATLLVTGAPSQNLNRAARNLKQVEVTTAAQANTYQILRYPAILADAAGFAALVQRLGEGVE